MTNTNNLKTLGDSLTTAQSPVGDDGTVDASSELDVENRSLQEENDHMIQWPSDADAIVETNKLEINNDTSKEKQKGKAQSSGGKDGTANAPMLDILVNDSADGNDVTLKVSGSATFSFDGTIVECGHGSKISIIRGQKIENSSRVSSDSDFQKSTASRPVQNVGYVDEVEPIKPASPYEGPVQGFVPGQPEKPPLHRTPPPVSLSPSNVSMVALPSARHSFEFPLVQSDGLSFTCTVGKMPGKVGELGELEFCVWKFPLDGEFSFHAYMPTLLSERMQGPLMV